MKYSIRNIRILPVAVIMLLLVLTLMHLFMDRPAVSKGAFEQVNPEGMLAPPFKEVTAQTFEIAATGQAGRPANTFEILPNEKDQPVLCRAFFSFVKKEETYLSFSWYHENDSVYSEIAVIGAQDTACSSIIAIPRTRCGAWSVDIAAPNGSIIRTVSFSVVLKSMPRHFKSLRNKS